MKHGPLTGLRVVDCSTGTAAPRASGMLADYGADVVWVERPGGDPHRGPLAREYAVFNRGKRSVCLDLRDGAGRHGLDQLLAHADVLIDNRPPGSEARLGLDHHRVHAEFPSLVHCSITGFGSEGPWRDLRGYEPIVHAVLGSMGEQIGHRDGPVYLGIPFASIGAAHLAVIGALAAIYSRFDDGIGRRVETSLLDGALAYLSIRWGDSDQNVKPHVPGANRLIAATYECADGEYLGVHTGAVGAFGRLMALVGLEHEFPPVPPGTDMGVPLSDTQRKLVQVDLPEIFRTKSRSSWLTLLHDADICAIPHLHPGQVFDEPQALHNHMVVSVDDPELGTVEQVGPAVRIDEWFPETLRPCPRTGVDQDWLDAGGWTGTSPFSVAREPSQPAASAGKRASQPPLAGLRVLDLGAYYAGPYTSRLLADLGADVVKLEPLAGDPMRGLPLTFRSAQAGKRSIAADLKSPDTREILDHLLSWADVVHHNFRPGAAERLGVGFDDAVAMNPQILYLHAPGWGSTGPASALQSFAPLMSAYVGVEFEMAGRLNPPIWPVANEDPGNGLVGAFAVLIALVRGRASGAEARLIENPQLNAAMTHLAHVVRRDGEVLGAERLDPLQFGIDAFNRLALTSDGWICVAAYTDAERAALLAECELVRSDFDDDDALADAVADRLAKDTTQAWLDRFAASGVPAARPHIDPHGKGFLADPINQDSGRAVEHPHPRDRRVRGLGPLIRVFPGAPSAFRLAPELGEHTDELLESLGFGIDDIERLHERGVVR